MIVVALLATTPTTVQAAEPPTEALSAVETFMESRVITAPPEPELEYSPETAPLILTRVAEKYGIDAADFVALAHCESKFIPQQSRIPANGPNGREDSWGVFQIHLPSHPSVTRQEALEPTFAMEWAAKAISEGQARMWTCSRTLHLFGL